MIERSLTVEIDRPVHSNQKNIVYKLNYGFVAPDGELQDAYAIDEKEPLFKVTGKVIGIAHRRNNIEDKLLLATKENKYKNEELLALVNFQEQFF